MTRLGDTSLEQLTFPRADEHARQRLFQQALIATAAVLAGLWWTAPGPRDLTFLLGATICLLSLVPALIWARTMRHNYPFFEIFLATNVTSYAIPLINEPAVVQLFDDRVREAAALWVILFLAAAMLAYYGTRAHPRPLPFWTQAALERPNKQWMLRGLVAATLYTLVVPYFYYPPAGVAGILRAVLFGIGTSCTFILGVAWGLGRLRPGEKAVIALCLTLQFFLLSSSLVLRSGVSIIILAYVGYFFGSRRIPYVALILTVGLFALLNIGKYDLRKAYWTEDDQRQPDLQELPAFYAQWVQAGLHPRAERGAGAGKLLLERNSLLQILCLVVDRSPDYLPYLHGETYYQTLGQLVPRVLWPGKPRGHISTYTLSIYYGLQDKEATYSTTIAFGLLPEAYANFGAWGIAGLGAVFGFAFRKITLWSAQSPVFSYGGLLLILLTAWSFQTELTMSAWLVSLAQGAFSIFAFAFVFRRVQQAAP